MYVQLVISKKLWEFFLQNETDFNKKFEFLVVQNFIQLVQSILVPPLYAKKFPLLDSFVAINKRQTRKSPVVKVT